MRRFQEIVRKRAQIAERIARSIAEKIEENNAEKAFLFLENNATKQLQKINAQLLFVQNDSLLLWTTPVNKSTWQHIHEEGNIVWINGTWYFAEFKRIESYDVALLIALRREYPLINQFLTPQWDHSLRFLEGKQTPTLALRIPSLALKSSIPPTDSHSASLVGHILLLFSLLLAPTILPKAWKRWTTWGSIALITTARFIAQKYTPFTGLIGDLFLPQLFAIAPFFPSLGDLLLHALSFSGCIALLANLYRHANYRRNATRLTLWLLWGTLSAILAQTCDIIIHSLVINSTIPISPQLFANLSPYALLLFIALGLLFSSTLHAATLFHTSTPYQSTKKTLIVWFILNATIALGLFIARVHISPWGVILGAATVPLMHLLHVKTPVSIGQLVIASLVIAAYVNITLQKETKAKNKLIDNRLKETIGSERDLILEINLRTIAHRTTQDSTLLELTEICGDDPTPLYEHFTRRYITDYLTAYDCQLTLCYPETQLLLSETNQLAHCHKFFGNMAERLGEPISGTNFHYLHNQNGRISYLGAIHLSISEKYIATLFIELDSKLPRFFWGYPELLVHGNKAKNQPTDNLSTALYYQTHIVSQSGPFPYPTKINPDNPELIEPRNPLTNHYTHTLYQTKNNDTLIISRITPTLLEQVGGAIYLTVILLITLSLYAACALLLPTTTLATKGLTARIQRLVLIILLLAHTTAITGTLYAVRRNFRKNQFSTLNERLLMVHAHLDDFQHNEHSSGAQEQEHTNWWLANISNSLHCDINLYDTNGWLIGSSRAEIFANHLTGQKMHPTAWLAMACHHSAVHLQQEQIGSMQYSSIYAPLTRQGKTIAYINIPHFTQPFELKRQYVALTSLIVNIFFINTTLAMLLTLLLANKLIEPIRKLRESVENISITDENAPIEYHYDDEVGHLVKAYNTMLAELQRSAQKLALSERQGAWREMAQQIAHDIKNPLTPIKLNLQYLNSLRRENAPNWDEKFNAFTQMLQTQINKLARTADSFSQFAKTSHGISTSTSPNPLIRQEVELHRVLPNITWRYDIEPSEEITIWIDPANFQRVINNLLTNAVQAIGNQANGQIRIATTLQKSLLIITIQDNGCGIPPEIASRIFHVSFTTKSEGSGLGLAITNTIIQSANGKITFHTKPDHGTTFTLELPIHTHKSC